VASVLLVLWIIQRIFKISQIKLGKDNGNLTVKSNFIKKLINRNEMYCLDPGSGKKSNNPFQPFFIRLIKRIEFRAVHIEYAGDLSGFVTEGNNDL